MSSSPLDADLTLTCAQRLQSAVTALSRRLRARPEATGTSTARLSVLAQLYRHGPMAPAELARRERVRPQTLTRLLAELEGLGQLERNPHPTDARQSLLSLTTPGRALLAQEARRREALLARSIAQQLTPAQAQSLLDTCALLERLADTLPPDGAGAADPGA